jgi:beta-phosphoglucomutase-like phosphatase (HAD superfamily)
VCGNDASSLTSSGKLRSKPHPDIFLEAAHRMGVDPADCLVVEDSTAGVRAAVTAGMKVVLVQRDAELLARDAEAVAMVTAHLESLTEWNTVAEITGIRVDE